MRTRSVTPYVVAGLAAIAVAAAGGLLTDVGPWYQSLRKPAFQPPDWLFAPVWTTLYALCAVSAGLAWQGARDAGERALVARAFIANAILNVGWSALFFAIRQPVLALVEIVLLWISIAVLVAVTARASRLAAVLLTPYLAWVSFAALLNFAIVRAN